MRRASARFWPYAAAILLGAICPAFGQGIPSRPSTGEIVQDNLERRINDMRNLDVLSRRTAAKERQAVKERYYLPELTDDLVRRRTVPQSVLVNYSKVLKQSNSGAVRLLFPPDCSRVTRISRLTKCYQENANIRGFANAYSFRENKRAVFARSDIALSEKYLFAGRHSVQTLLVSLGNADLAAIGRDSPEVSFLFAFRPAEDPKGMDAQFAELVNGLTIAAFDGDTETGRRTYSKMALVERGCTYALRSIAYRPEGEDPLPKDADVVVVFKLVERSGSGATIVWKEIARGEGVQMKKDEERE